jgi:hypothetical protein
MYEELKKTELLFLFGNVACQPTFVSSTTQETTN